jgi:hypothetical protein
LFSSVQNKDSFFITAKIAKRRETQEKAGISRIFRALSRLNQCFVFTVHELYGQFNGGFLLNKKKRAGAGQAVFLRTDPVPRNRAVNGTSDANCAGAGKVRSGARKMRRSPNAPRRKSPGSVTPTCTESPA